MTGIVIIKDVAAPGTVVHNVNLYVKSLNLMLKDELVPTFFVPKII